MTGRSSALRPALLGLAVLLLACSPRPAASDYVTAVAGIGDVRDVVPATGTLLASGGAEIRAPRTGVIAEVLVREGDTVRAGQVLARLASATRGAAIDEALANAQAAEASLGEASVALRSAEEKLQRTRQLWSRDFVSQAAVRNSEAEVERARAAIERLDSERAAAQARARLARAEGEAADIVAPLDGVVTMAAARVGQQASPEDERPLFQTGQDIRALTLEILVSEADLPRVTPASRVRFSVDAYPGVYEEADLTSIGSAPIREGRFVSYRALASVNNRAEVLKPGMSASVQIVRADARNALRIPAQAVYFMPDDYTPPVPPEALEQMKREYHGDMRAVRAGARGLEFRRMLLNGTRIVFALENGRPVRREIRVGAETDDFIEVTEGLREGDVVILAKAGRASGRPT